LIILFQKLKVHVSQGENKEFQFKAHPNMNKNLYNESILALKDPTKAYAVGVASSILKWRYTSKDEKNVPLTINVWPSTSGGETTVPVEYEKNCNFDLIDVVIAIPIPGSSPVIGDCVGSCDFDSRKGVLFWRIPFIDESNKSGSMEFNVPTAPNTAFFSLFKSISVQIQLIVRFKLFLLLAKKLTNQSILQETLLSLWNNTRSSRFVRFC